MIAIPTENPVADPGLILNKKHTSIQKIIPLHGRYKILILHFN